MPAISATGRLRRLHVVRLEPGAQRHQRRARRVPAGSRHRRRWRLRRARGCRDDPRQRAPRPAGQRRQQEPAITPDGRYVVFTSFASNLFTSGQPALTVSVVLRWDRTTGDIVLVSQTTAGQPLLAVRSVDSDVSDDGNQVVFGMAAASRVNPMPGFRGVIYRRDIAAGTLTQVSADATGRRPVRASTTSCRRSPATAATIVYRCRAGRVRRSDAEPSSSMSSMPPRTPSEPRMSAGQPRLSRDGALFVFIEGLGAGRFASTWQAASAAAASRTLEQQSRMRGLSPSGRFLLSGFLGRLRATAFAGGVASYSIRSPSTPADTLLAHRQALSRRRQRPGGPAGQR